jgi:hypothetical protein
MSAVLLGARNVEMIREFCVFLTPKQSRAIKQIQFNDSFLLADGRCLFENKPVY